MFYVSIIYLLTDAESDGVNVTHAEAIWILGTLRTLIIVYN